MDIEHANDHPFKVAVVGNDNGMYANSHPYKVSIVEGGSTFVTELPETGTPGTMYVLVDNIENPTKAYGIYTYNNGWVLASQPVDQAVKKVDELPEVGEEGILYYLAKEGDDTYDLYRWIDNTWIKVDTDIQLYNSEGNNTDGAMTQAATTALKGLARNLTPDDYDWPTDNPQRVALWKLPSGIYTHSQANIAIDEVNNVGWNQYLIIIDSTDANNTYMLLLDHNELLLVNKVRKSDGYSYGKRSFIESTDVINNLTSTSTTSPLSASQGKALKDLIDSLVIKGAGAPITSTVGTVGMLYEDTTNGDLYQLKSIDTTVTPNTYNWEQAGGSSVNVVQTTGTSTTDVMSQNAVTNLMKEKTSEENEMGQLCCYPYSINTAVEFFEGGVTSVEILDADKLLRFFMTHGGANRITGDDYYATKIERHSYSFGGLWYYYPDEFEGSATTFKDVSDIETQMGVRIVDSTDNPYGQVAFMITASVDTSVYNYSTVRILGQKQLDACSFESGAFYGPLDADGKIVPKEAIQGFGYATGNSLDCGAWPNRFLCNCPNLSQIYNQGGSAVRISTIGNSVASNCPKLTWVDFRAYGESIGPSFCAYDSALTSFSFGEAYSSYGYFKIGDYFLYGCSSLASGTIVVNANEIGNEFMSQCTAFNGTVTLKGVWRIGDGFMRSCVAFNKALSLTETISIGGYFLHNCTAYSQPIALGRALSSLGSGFLYMANNVPSVNVKNIRINDVCVLSTDNVRNSMLSTTSNTAASYTTGITIYGDAASDWIAALPDRTASPYRKLLNGNS